MSRKLREDNQQQKPEPQVVHNVAPSATNTPQDDLGIPKMRYERALRPSSVATDKTTGALTPEYTEGK